MGVYNFCTLLRRSNLNNVEETESACEKKEGKRDGSAATEIMSKTEELHPTPASRNGEPLFYSLQRSGIDLEYVD